MPWLPCDVFNPIDANAHRKTRIHGMDAEISEKPTEISCQTTVCTRLISDREPRRKSKYVIIVAIEAAATRRRKENTKTIKRFFDALTWTSEMNQAGRAMIVSSVATSRAVRTAHLTIYRLSVRDEATTKCVDDIRSHHKLRRLQSPVTAADGSQQSSGARLLRRTHRPDHTRP